MGALRAAVEVRFSEGCVTRLEDTMLGVCFYGNWRALTRGSLAGVARMWMSLKKGADLTQVKVKPRVYAVRRVSGLKSMLSYSAC